MYHPWFYPSKLVASGELDWSLIAAGILGGVIFVILSGRSFVRRDVL